jgi:hypothetical protein
MRLSAAFTRWAAAGFATGFDEAPAAGLKTGAGKTGSSIKTLALFTAAENTADLMSIDASSDGAGTAPLVETFGAEFEELLTSSSQTSMCIRPVISNYRSVVREHQALVDIVALPMLWHRIEGVCCGCLMGFKNHCNRARAVHQKRCPQRAQHLPMHGLVNH